MIPVRELRRFAETLRRDEFRHQLGPFVLIQRPAEEVLKQVALTLGASRTIGMATRNRLVDEVFAMVRGFEHLIVSGLPPMGDAAEINVGRMPDCELVVEEPSVSKHHAVVRWDAAQGGCSVQDLGSSNGTFVNTRALGRDEEKLLTDGDVISFGDAQFLYFLTDSLHAHLVGAGLAR
jgi:hypothetical protein